MAERVATLAVLNKQNGKTQQLKMRPGQAVRLGGVIVRLRACETTPDWEKPSFTGAFIQVDVADPKGQFRRVFSGWTYAETPSLNPVAHQVYDVWVKSCAMRFPESAPEPAASPPRAAPAGASSPSSAPKSAGVATASDNSD